MAEIIEQIGAGTLLTPLTVRRRGARTKTQCISRQKKKKKTQNTHAPNETHKKEGKKSLFQSNNAL